VIACCRDFAEAVTDYLEGAMPEELRLRFDRHIAECSGCRTYLEQMRLTIHATGMLTVDGVTPEAEQALLEAFRDWPR